VPSYNWRVAVDFMQYAVFYWRALNNSILYRQSVITMNSIIDGSTVCPTSEVSPTVTVTVQKLVDGKPLETVSRYAASRILRKAELSIHVVSCTCIYRGIQLKYKIQHTGKWLEAAWPPRCQCYRPAVFFHHLPVITLSHREETFGMLVKNVIISNILIF